jgi:hypothetical protein
LPLFNNKKKAADAGKPTPPPSPRLTFGDVSLRGAIYSNEDFADGNADVTETANTGASTDETWLNILNPSTTARFIRSSVSKMLINLQTATPAQITSGSLSFWLANNDTSRSRLVNRIDLNSFDTLSNQRSALYRKPFPFDIALAPSYRLLVKVNSASTLSTSNSTFSFSDVRKVTNVTIDSFLKDYPDWAVV